LWTHSEEINEALLSFAGTRAPSDATVRELAFASATAAV
jgi:hypothetical protein